MEIREMAKKQLGIKNLEISEKKASIDGKIKVIQSRIFSAEEKWLDGEINQERFLKIEARYKKEIQNLGTSSENSTDYNESEKRKIIINALELVNSAGQTYLSLSRKKKAEFIKSVLLELSLNSGNTVFNIKKEAEHVFNFCKIPNGGVEGTRTLDLRRDRAAL